MSHPKARARTVTLAMRPWRYHGIQSKALAMPCLVRTGVLHTCGGCLWQAEKLACLCGRLVKGRRFFGTARNLWNARTLRLGFGALRPVRATQQVRPLWI